MTNNESMPADESKPTDVPVQVFEEFLAALPDVEIAEDVIARLRKVLLVDRRYTDIALRSAVFGEED